MHAAEFDEDIDLLADDDELDAGDEIADGPSAGQQGGNGHGPQGKLSTPRRYPFKQSKELAVRANGHFRSFFAMAVDTDLIVTIRRNDDEGGFPVFEISGIHRS